jgi:hypothetical protein
MKLLLNFVGNDPFQGIFNSWVLQRFDQSGDGFIIWLRKGTFPGICGRDADDK